MTPKTFLQSCELMNNMYNLEYEDMYNLMLDNAVAYLHWYVNGDPNAKALWLETPEFWQWWLQLWLRKDESMQREKRYFENPWRTYQVLHRPDFITHLTPNSLVYDAVIKRAKAKRLDDLQLSAQVAELLAETEVIHA